MNVLLGQIVAAGPWFLSSATTGFAILCTGIGTAVITLAVPPGQKTEDYGSWDRYVR